MSNSAELTIHNLNNLREAAMTLLREVESLTNTHPHIDQKLGLQEEVQRYENSFAKRSNALAAINVVRQNYSA